jgi:hypothetical protein
MMRKIAVLVTVSALALSLPVVSSFAEQPHEPNGGQGKHCQNIGKRKGQGPKELPDQASKGIGWKCAFKTGLTAAS